MRTKRAELRQTVDRLNKKGAQISIDCMMGRSRIVEQNNNRYLSPRGTTKEIAVWLDGFETAWDRACERVAKGILTALDAGKKS